MKVKKPKYNEALKIASRMLSDSGFCTHYPGYTCDKGFPKACPACVKRWLLDKARMDCNKILR